jgi:hypothetical protein
MKSTACHSQVRHNFQNQTKLHISLIPKLQSNCYIYWFRLAYNLALDKTDCHTRLGNIADIGMLLLLLE